MAFRKENKTKSNFSKISIGLASPEEILENSSGEVLKPETINYRTYKPERDGLFCERIFGPIKDYECHCGKYKRIRYKGIVCDRCGVEVTEKKVRRERMGHIQLVVPVAHIWYFRSLPNKIGYLLGLPTKKLDSIIYYERYVVIQPGVKAEDGVAEYDLLSEEEYLDMQDELIDRFGDIPKSVDNLLRVAELKAMAHRAYVTEVDINTQEIRIELYPKAKLDVTGIPALIAEYKTALRFAQGEKPVLFYQDKGKKHKDCEPMMEKAKELLGKLGELAESKK